MENSRKNIQGNQIPSSLGSAYNLGNWGNRLEVGWRWRTVVEKLLPQSNCLLPLTPLSGLHFAFFRESGLVGASFRVSPLLSSDQYSFWTFCLCVHGNHGAIFRRWWQTKRPHPSIRRHFVAGQLCRSLFSCLVGVICCKEGVKANSYRGLWLLPVATLSRVNPLAC